MDKPSRMENLSNGILSAGLSETLGEGVSELVDSNERNIPTVESGKIDENIISELGLESVTENIEKVFDGITDVAGDMVDGIANAIGDILENIDL